MKINNRILFLLICLIVIIAILIRPRYTEERAWNELVNLDSDISMSDLIQKGYIDVSQTFDSQNKEISSFLRKAQNRQDCFLRIATVSEEKLCAKILMYNEDYDVIRMYTIYPKQQQADSPGKCFSTQSYEIEDSGIVTVYLKNVPDLSLPISARQELTDEKLYAYFNSDSS